MSWIHADAVSSRDHWRENCCGLH